MVGTGIPEMRTFFALQNGVEEQLKNKDCERIDITAADGIKLVGHLRTCENAERIIIAMYYMPNSAHRHDFDSREAGTDEKGNCI